MEINTSVPTWYKDSPVLICILFSNPLPHRRGKGTIVVHCTVVLANHDYYQFSTK